MGRLKYKEAYKILMKNKKMWEHLTDKDKKEIFMELNKKAGFNFYLEDYLA